MNFYLNVFVLAGIVSGAIVHFITREPMPWWPDTAIMGAFFGAIAALGAIRYRQRFERRRRRGRDGVSDARRSQLYSGMFSACAVGLLLLIAGLAGYDADRNAAFRAGTPWTGRTIAWEVAFGAGLLLVAAVIYSRLTRWVVVRNGAPTPGTKSAGSGRSTGAERGGARPQLPDSAQDD